VTHHRVNDFVCSGGLLINRPSLAAKKWDTIHKPRAARHRVRAGLHQHRTQLRHDPDWKPGHTGYNVAPAQGQASLLPGGAKRRSDAQRSPTRTERPGLRGNEAGQQAPW